jgi:hypothetical protein
MKSMHTIDYFINKFKKIPSRKWCVGSFRRGNKFCALGHCGINDRSNTINRESKALVRILSKLGPVSYINDGKWGYKPLGNNAKTRILKALKSVKKWKKLSGKRLRQRLRIK